MQRAHVENAWQALSGARCALHLLAEGAGLRTGQRELVKTSLVQISRAERALSRIIP
jgi:hypothetical protein